MSTDPKPTRPAALASDGKQPSKPKRSGESNLEEQASPQEILRAALLADPATPSGQHIRALARSVHLSLAQDLIARSAGLPSAAAEPHRKRARELLYSAILLEQVELKPASDVSVDPCASLLDPPPDPPADVMAAATGLGARVRWTIPDDHGKPITRYDITPTPKPLVGLSVSISGNEAEVTGLTPGTNYTFTVTATNADGTSAPSAPSNPMRTDKAPPGQPQQITAKSSGAAATLEWTAPSTGAPFTAFWVTVYDATQLTPVLPVRKLPGDASSTNFHELPKGIYVYGVRAFNAGGHGAETRSAAHTFDPAPTPFTPTGLPQVKTDPLELFDLDSTSELLRPDVLQRRLGPALEKANKWRYEYLKSLATKAATDTLQYEHFLGQLLQMTVGKVTSAQLLLSPVLQGTIDDLLKNTRTVADVTAAPVVSEIVGRVGEAAANALALEALLFFLLDNSPLEFWVGLFDGMIRDVAHFDVGLNRTERFLTEDYFSGLAGAQLLAAVRRLAEQVDAQVDELMKPLAAAVEEIAAGTLEALHQVVDSINETVVAVSTVSGGHLYAGTPFPVIEGLIDELKNEVQRVKRSLKEAMERALQVNSIELMVRLIKAFIAYPILGILVISFALGPIGAGLLAAIVLVASVELVRLVARLLAGPLLDGLNSARQLVIDTVGELSTVVSSTIALLQTPQANLQQVAGHLLALEQLLPREFMNAVAALVGEARRALLGQATELALAAERALGMENATAFDIISPNYDSGLPNAPKLPGGSDDNLLAGMAMLRDLDQLDRLRTRIQDGKEVVVTQRLSLFRLLGGTGSPLGATGAAAAELARLASGRQIIVKLTEESIVEHGYPGLYRTMIVDLKPIGLLAAPSAVTAVLPVGVPLSLTHLGPSRMRVRRDANPDAPPVTLPEVLQQPSEDWATHVLDSQIGPANGAPAGALADAERSALESIGQQPPSSSVAQRLKLTFLRELPTRLAVHTRPAVSLEELRAVMIPVLEEVFTAAGLDVPDPGAQMAERLREVLVRADGVIAQLREVLRPLLVHGHRREVSRLQGQLAKWAGARYEEDRDSHAQALGYVTLVQDFPVETAVFNLLPPLPGSPAAGSILAAGGVGPQTAPPARVAEAPATALQYRPFENRGVEGDWLLSTEGELAPGTLIDILLEVTIRGCWDERLAAGVKANRQQRASQLRRAEAAAAQVNKKLSMPGSLPELLAASSDIRTIHFSLRAHRDNLLRNALAAAAALGSDRVDGLDLRQGVVPLGAKDPFTPLAKSGLQTITVRFQTEPPQSLEVLNDLIPVTPQILGIPEVLTYSEPGEIVSLGLVIIPSWNVSRPPDGPAIEQESYAIQALNIDSLLKPLLPQLDPAKTDDLNPDRRQEPDYPQNNFDKNRSKAFFITVPPPPPAVPIAVPLRQVWENALPGAAGTVGADGNLREPPHVGVDMGDALNKGYIHDVIFSISIRVPVSQLQIAPGVA